MTRRNAGLLALIVANVFASILHYGHNIAFLPRYFEPSWITGRRIDVFWFVMTPFAVAGYVLFRRGRERAGCRFLYVYCACSLLVLGHYAPWVTPIRRLTWDIHLLIVQEALLAIALALYARRLAMRAGVA